MEISFDSKADALYIQLQKGKFAKNKKLDKDTILDLDTDGRIIGIEMLNVSSRVPVEDLEAVRVRLPLKA